LTTASPLALAPDRPFAGIVAWCRARSWLAIALVLGAWALMPGVRRLFDWRAGGFASVSLLSIVPLIALVPAALALTYGGRLRYVDGRLALCAWLWTGGFGFAFVVALVNGGSPFAATYALGQFILPMAFGLWVATLDVPVGVLYERIADVLLWLSTPLCLYAALQFAAPPPWDVSWMQHANIVSIGPPYPYQLRPFSTLNGPGVFADFLDITLAINLPRLIASRSPLRIAQFSLCLAALALTMVRTGWLGFAVAIVTYLALTPHRTRNLAVFGGVAAVVAVVIVNASLLLGSAQTGSDITARFSTLGNLNDDYSFVDRQRYFEGLLTSALAQPLGQGLGVTGTAAKLGAGGTVKDFDNGFIARFTEMGYFGMACYMAALGWMIALAFGAWRRYAARGLPRLTAIAAAVVAVQVMLFALDVSSDHHNALAGIAFWLTMALVLGRDRPLDRAR
jgi:putative inorganic carbon (hco3(-)) transporter